MHKIAVLAVGPGSPAYLTPAVIEEAKKCDLLVGGKRNLALFDQPGREEVVIRGELAPVLALIRENMGRRKIGILVSGDAGIYSILPRLVREFGRQTLEVFPGVSAVQYFFARLGLTWQDAHFISLHGRDLEDLARLVADKALVVLFTDKKNSPARICRRLAEAGITGKTVHIGEDLSYPTEKIITGSPQDLVAHEGSDLNMVVISDQYV